MLDEIKKIKSTRKELREFGLTIGAVLVILGGVALWRGKAPWPYLFAAGAVFAVLGLAAPMILKPAQKAWMTLGIVFGFFASRIVLTLLFYGVITPMGLAVKAAGKDILDERTDKSKASYWKERAETKSNSSYENQY